MIRGVRRMGRGVLVPVGDHRLDAGGTASASVPSEGERGAEEGGAT